MVSLLPTPNLYSSRYVVFIDILGFGELIQRSEGDSELLEKLTAALQRIYYTKPPWERGEPLNVEPPSEQLIRNRWQVHTFSDCIAMSTPATVKGLAWLLGEASRLAFSLLSMGILTRGGLSVGSLIHDDAKVLGPAIVEAAGIEKNADMPRIVASQDVLRHACDSEISSDGEKKAISLFRKDADGSHYLDYLAWNASSIETNIIASPQGLVASKEMWAASMEHSRAAIWLRIQQESQEQYLKRAQWLASWFNVVAQQHSLPLEPIPLDQP